MEKERKTNGKISGQSIRSAAYAMVFLFTFIAFSWVFHSAGAIGRDDTTVRIASQPRAFTFAERVAFQRAIEGVYWRHRIWPKDNPDSKPALDAVVSQAQLEKKVENYLHDSLVLEEYWQKPITAEQLQTEMARMARNTKQPKVLRELFEVLANDPAIIAECLARPIVAERLIADLSVQGEPCRVESPRRGNLPTMRVGTTLGQPVYNLPRIAEPSDPPCSDDTWTATTTSNSPSARWGHTAVWTGTEMVVWGGIGGSDSGGRYNPSTDSWIATSLINAPSARYDHTAVWTGTEMIVWGGTGDSLFDTGGRYNPITDSWSVTSTNNAPSARRSFTAVWSGSEMIVWGGYDVSSPYPNTGGRYNPGTDRWTPISTTNAPTGRYDHTAVWTGSEMIVWGGVDGTLPYVNTGGRYNPGTNTWTPTSTNNAPTSQYIRTAVWTGSEMIVFAGAQPANIGGRYNPSTDSWRSISTTGAPDWGGSAVWTGNEMIVWNWNTGGRYNPDADSWTTMTTVNAPSPRGYHTAVWTGSEMIIWGGFDGTNFLNTGGRYCAEGGPTPTPTPCTGRCAPTPRPRPTPR